MLTESEAVELRRLNEFRVEELGKSPIKTHKAVCPGCKGEGVRLCDSIRGHAYTQDDIAEMGDEWDEFVSDMRAGVYNETCDVCNGLRVIDDFDLMADTDDAREFHDWLQDAYEMRSIYEMERRMGA